MPKQPHRALYTLFGQVIWGDFADLTMYRRPDGRLVVFAKTWPDKPPSPAQVTQRQAMSDAAAAWQALDPSQQSEWTQAAARASLTMHGYDLYVHWQLIGDDAAMRTLERQTNTNLIP